MTNFLSTVYGSWLKVFISAVLGAYLVMLQDGRQLFSWDLDMVENLLSVGVVSTLPVIINWFNPTDMRYGK